MRLLLRMQLFCHRWHTRRSPQCTVCRQCTTCVLCGSCLSLFQICVCVSGLVSVLSVSKFIVRRSSSTVTKSLSSSAGASCLSKKKVKSNVFIYWKATRKSRESCSGPALRHNRDFNIATVELLKGSCLYAVWACKFSSKSINLQLWYRPLFSLKMHKILDHLRQLFAFL